MDFYDASGDEIMITGTSKFTSGVTTIDRSATPDALNKISGWSTENGYAEPIGFPKEVVAGTGFVASSKPSFIYTDVARETMLCVDASDHLWEVNLTDSPVTMVDTGYLCDMEDDSMMVRMGKQVVIPCLDGLKVWEPGTDHGTVRLLSIKSPEDYIEGAKPTATLTQNSAVMLFSDTANNWVADKGGSPDEDASRVIFPLTSASTNGCIASRSIGATGISLSGLEWMLLDVKITGDTQDYSRTGLFVNNPGLIPSGYSLRLFSDESCTTLITSILIPKLETDSKIHRCLFNVAGFTSTVKGVGLYAEDFCVPPAGSGTRSITLYTEAWRSDWKHKGSFLLPAFSFSASPLSEYTKVDAGVASSSATNLLADHGGFEQTIVDKTVIDGWSKEGGLAGEPLPYVSGQDWYISEVKTYRDMPRSGSVSCNIEGNQSTKDEDDIDRIKQIKSEVVACKANTRYKLEYWIRRPRIVTGTRWGDPEVYDTVKFYSKITATGSATSYLYPFHSGGVWSATDLNQSEIISSTMREEWCSNDYKQIIDYFVTPSTATGIAVTIGVNPTDFYGGVNVDDVSLTEVNVNASGSTYIIQDFADDGSDVTNELPQMRYRYAFCGKSSSSTRDYYLMISNPSADSSPTLVADPWGSFTITASIPTGVATDYAGLITDIAFYRSVYDVTLGTWGQYYLCGKGVISAGSASCIDTGDIVDLYVGDFALPYVMETSNDFGFSAKHVTYADNRLYCGNLEYALDEGQTVTSSWQRATTMQISTWNKAYAFPTTTDSTSPPSYGSELEGFTKLTSDIRHIDNVGSTKFVFGDQEIYAIAGNNSSDGWYAVQADTIGCISSRFAVCRREGIIWYDGDYFYMLTGEGVQNISSMRIKKGMIDLTKSYGACGCSSKYYCYCYYDGAWSLLEYDLYLNAWFVHVSPMYELKSICSSYDTAYGVIESGTDDSIVQITGTAVEIGDRVITTAYIACGDPSVDTQLSEALIDASVTANCTATVVITYLGKKNDTVTRTIAMTPDVTRYHVNVNALASAAKISVSFDDANCPKINFIGFLYDGAAR